MFRLSALAATAAPTATALVAGTVLGVRLRGQSAGPASSPSTARCRGPPRSSGLPPISAAIPPSTRTAGVPVDGIPSVIPASPSHRRVDRCPRQPGDPWNNPSRTERTRYVTTDISPTGHSGTPKRAHATRPALYLVPPHRLVARRSTTPDEYGEGATDGMGFIRRHLIITSLVGVILAVGMIMVWIGIATGDRPTGSLSALPTASTSSTIRIGWSFPRRRVGRRWRPRRARPWRYRHPPHP